MPAWLAAVVAVNFFLQVAVSAARPLTSVRALGLGADNFDLGLIAAAYAGLALLVAVPIGQLIDRWGAPFFIAAGSLLLVAMLLASAVADSTLVLIAIQSGVGLALISANLGMQSTIAARSSQATSASAFGHYSTGAGIGLLVGPALAGVLVELGERIEGGAGTPPQPDLTSPAFLVLAGVAAIATMIAGVLSFAGTKPAPAARQPESAAQSAGRKRLLLAILRQPEVKPVLIASAIFVTTLDLMAIYMPAFGLERGYSIAYVGLLLSIAAAGSIAARLLTGVVTRRLGRTRVMLLSLLVPAAALVFLPLVPPAALPASMAIIGLGLGFGQPTTMAWIASLADADRLAATMGVRISGNRLGQLLVPLVVASAIAVSSLSAAFWTLAALLAGTALLFCRPFAGGRSGGSD